MSAAVSNAIVRIVSKISGTSAHSLSYARQKYYAQHNFLTPTCGTKAVLQYTAWNQGSKVKREHERNEWKEGQLSECGGKQSVNGDLQDGWMNEMSAVAV